MLLLAAKIPRKIVVACSGGADSMALLSFCINGRKDITVLHVDHKTEHAAQARKMVTDFCFEHKLNLEVREVETTEHNELAWRNERLGFYREFTDKGFTVATAHHLGDAAEWYLFTALHGAAKFMAPEDKEHGLIKPFLHTEKQELIDWCDRFKVPYITDPTNAGEDNARAILRGVMPQLLKIHSGFYSSIRNKMTKD